MIYRRIWTVGCDYPGCTDTYDCSYEDRQGAEDEVVEHGEWHVVQRGRKRLHLCPEHGVAQAAALDVEAAKEGA